MPSHTPDKAGNLPTDHLQRVLYAIRKVNAMLITEHSVPSLVQKACDLLTETRDYYNTWILLTDDEDYQLFFTAASSGDLNQYQKIQESLHRDDMPECARKAIEKGSLHITDRPSEQCPGCPMANEYKGRIAYTTPLVYNEIIYGVVSVSLSKELAEKSSEHELFSELTAHIAFALHSIKIASAKISEEKHHESIIAQSVNVFYTHDKDHKLIYVSPQIETVLGYTPEEAKRRWTEFLTGHPLNQKGLQSTIKALSTGVAQPTYELELRRKDGQKVWVEVKETPLLEMGEVKGITGSLTDITEKKNALKALKESEERFRLLSDVTFEGIVIHQNGQIIDVNLAFEKITGFSKEEAIGQNLFQSLVSDEDYRKAAINVQKNHAKPYEVRAKRRDGKVLWLEIEGRDIVHKDDEVRIVAIRDISEKIKAREALSESEEKYRSFVDNSLEGIFVVQDERFVYTNPTISRISGYNFNEISSLKFVDFVFTDDRKLIAENHKKRIRGENIPSYDFRIMDKWGEARWVHLNATNIIWNKKPAVLCFISDIHQRKLAENALIESEYKYKQLIESTSEAFWLLDKDKLTVEVNKSFCELLGYTADEVIGKTPLEFFDDKNKRICIEQLERIEETKHRTYEISIRKKDGTNVPAIFNATTLFDEQGEIIGAFSLIQDISHIKKTERALIENEERYRKAQELGNVGNWEYDIQTTHFWGSEQAKRIYGYDSTAPEFTTEDIESCIPEREKVHQALIDLINEDKEYNLEFDIITKDKGERKTIVSLAQLEKDVHGKPLRVTGVIHDITARKKVERELIKAKEKAVEADLLKSAFLANMSHEIRTPMNGILGFADLLKEPDLSIEKQEKYLGIIEKSGKRMLGIINDLIDISKIEAGQVEVNLSPTDINEQLDYLFTFFKPEASRKGLRLIRKSCPPHTVILCDKEKLYAILINLIKNAIKYTHEGMVTFGCRLFDPEADSHIEFFVEDTGIGIPESRQQAVFKRFVQADIEDKQAYEGSGLGLSISHAYAQMLGGQLKLKSVPGKGSAFFLTLPFNEAKMLVKDEKHQEDFEKESKAHHLKILIVEDDETSRLHLSILLKDYSSRLLFAGTGKEAVAILRDSPDIDVILMDIKLPGMDGYQASREIRKFNSNVKIIAQTAYALSGDKEKALAAGCNAYISKPINKDALYKALRD